MILKPSKVIIVLLPLVLLVILTSQLIKTPFYIFPSINLTVIFLIAILIGSIIISGIINVFIKRNSFLTIFSIISSIVFMISIYKFYSPTLKIIVPKGYVGRVTLVLSNSNEDILTVDTNGIGYITKFTFEKVYSKPIILEVDGTDITNQAVGFSSSSFWAKTIPDTHRDRNYQNAMDINFISFEIYSKDNTKHKTYKSIDLMNVVDKSKLLSKN